uniref:Uncharacterized protein n=1 Tax=Romanomermis culicivorax TaxID=13658 RepID=A0A915LBQ2_ROMCU
MEKASIVTIFAVGKIFIPMKIFPMAVSNSIVQKSFANGTFRETVDGDDSPTPFYRCCPQQRKKCFYYSPLFRHQINRSRDKENWATLRTVLKKRFYLSNTRRERTTADEEVEDENMQMNVSGELATVWRRTDDDSSESTTPSLSRKKRKAAWWTTNSNVGAAPTKISRKCFEHVIHSVSWDKITVFNLISSWSKFHMTKNQN